ncbi:MAG: hypothetical protein K5931_02360 [Lachnospiraceae bacterium]|nr:hypothetical protein [Lachnospiraceae bacterium]
MTNEQYVKRSVIITAVILLVICLLVIIIDPFSRYHKPLFGLAPVETEERYSVIGLARNMDYDTVLMGSSMSENFVDAWFEDGHFGNSCQKLSLQGAHQNDYYPVFEEILKRPGLKNVVFSLDNYLLDDERDKYPLTIPEYYMKKPGSITDIYYLLNKSVIFYFLPRFLMLNVSEGYSDDNAYVWADDYSFSKYIARADYIATRRIAPLEEKPYDYYFKNTDVIIENLNHYIKQRPDVTFYFYAPPYSILFWDVAKLDGSLTAEICALSRLYEALLQNPNVRLFYFQDDYDIVTDLDRYRDYSHYDQEVNRSMYEAMRNGDYEMTLDTYYDRLLDMYNYAATYDYESCFH